MARPRKPDEDVRRQLKNTRNMLYVERERVRIYKDAFESALQELKANGKEKAAGEIEREARRREEEHDRRSAGDFSGNAADGTAAPGAAVGPQPGATAGAQPAEEKTGGPEKA